jgi:hypothetical protein
MNLIQNYGTMNWIIAKYTFFTFSWHCHQAKNHASNISLKRVICRPQYTSQ